MGIGIDDRTRTLLPVVSPLLLIEPPAPNTFRGLPSFSSKPPASNRQTSNEHCALFVYPTLFRFRFSEGVQEPSIRRPRGCVLGQPDAGLQRRVVEEQAQHPPRRSQPPRVQRRRSRRCESVRGFPCLWWPFSDVLVFLATECVFFFLTWFCDRGARFQGIELRSIAFETIHTPNR